MMGPLCSGSSLKMTLTATVYIMAVLTTSSTKECRLQLGQKAKIRSVILGNIDIGTCHTNCVWDAFILAWCLQLRDSRLTGMMGDDSRQTGMLGDDSRQTGMLGDDSRQTGMPGDDSRQTGTPGDDSRQTGMLGDDSRQTGMLGDDSRQTGMLGDDSRPTGMPNDDSRPTGMPGDDSRQTGMPGDDSRQTGMPGDDSRQTGMLGDDSRQTGMLGDDSRQTGMLGDDSRPTGMPNDDSRPTGMPGDDSRQTGMPGDDTRPTGMPGDDSKQTGMPGDDSRPTGMPGDDSRQTGMPGDDSRQTGMPGDDSRQTGMPDGTSPETHHNVLKPPCGSKVCNTTSVCLEKGCSKECVQAPSFCDLHSASKIGDLAKVKVILPQGWSDINCEEWNSRTPVVLAAGEGHRDMVHLLVSNGADVSVVDDFGINLLHSACQGGDVALVKYVLSLRKHDINGKVLCGGTPVMLAAENGHRDVVELLVGQGANLLLQDKTGNNILHFACRGGDVEVVKYVLSQNMLDINSRGWKSMTPVMMAAQHGHRDVVELLVRKGASVLLKSASKNNILHFASREGQVVVVRYVLSLGIVDINSRGWKSMTPVMVATDSGHRKVVELLVRKGANVLLKDGKHNNILHFACRGGHVDVVKYILSLGMVDINSRGHKKMSPVFMAVTKGHKDVVEVLVRKGADVLLKHNKGNILHHACRGGHVEVVKYVLSQNMADINGRTRKRRTPVMIAQKYGHTEVVDFLVSKGADKK